MEPLTRQERQSPGGIGDLLVEPEIMVFQQSGSVAAPSNPSGERGLHLARLYRQHFCLHPVALG